MIPSTLEHLAVPIADLVPYEGNPRRGDRAFIRGSLQRFGQFRPIVVRVGTNQILAGNHTFEEARELGWTEIAATWMDVDDDTAERIMLADNRGNDLAGYAEAVLAERLRGLDDLSGTGWSRSDLAELLASFEPERAGTDTAAIDPPKRPKTKPGDLYVLGEHRLLCGDSTVRADVERLLDGQRPGLVYTDPPYGMSYKSSKHAVIKGDDLRGSKLEQLVRNAIGLADQMRAPGAAIYVWCTWRTYPEFVYALREVGLQASATIVWNKGRIGPGSSHYRPAHEFCLYCHPDEEGDHALCVYCAGETWGGGRGESDVWDIPRDSMKYVHPTQKPTPLAERALTNSSVPTDVVLDLFGGSGSTLIAADNLDRRAYVMELDPAYCDVIVDRWQRHTGRTAAREEAPRAAA